MAWDDKDVFDVTIRSDDESFAKMSGGDVDVSSYLHSRNTIGHGNHNSNSQRPDCVKTCRSAKQVSDGGCGRHWWYASAYAESGGGMGENPTEKFQFRQEWSDDR